MACVKEVMPWLPRVRMPFDELNDTLSSLPFKATSSIFDDEYVDVVDDSGLWGWRRGSPQC